MIDDGEFVPDDGCGPALDVLDRAEEWWWDEAACFRCSHCGAEWTLLPADLGECAPHVEPVDTPKPTTLAQAAELLDLELCTRGEWEEKLRKERACREVR